MNDIYLIFLTCYLLLIILYTFSFFLLIEYPNKLIILRSVLGRLYFIKNIKGNENDIIYQSSIEGCGLATIKMLFKRLKIIETIADDLIINYNFSLDMKSMSGIIESTGFNTTGYRFASIRQFENFYQLNPDSYIILLMKRYDTIDQISLMTIVFFPVYVITDFLNKLKLLNFPDFHWVILDKFSEKGAVLSDPFFGKILLTSSRFKSCWSRYGLVINK
ncbi:MAG: cysteine peptidase family C39 domain-containing protein [Calditrichaceae bacterium]